MIAGGTRKGKQIMDDPKIDSEEGEVSESEIVQDQEPLKKRKKYRGVSDIVDYNIEHKIGEGTFGQVLVGFHSREKDKVALKKIILHNDQEGMPVTSIREIQLIKRSNHHNIISLKEMAFAKGVLYHLKFRR